MRSSLEGTVNLGGLYNDEDVVDAAKMNDIRDSPTGCCSDGTSRAAATPTGSDFFGENISPRDQYVNLKGGSYGKFKYRLYSDSLTRNWLENGLTPYAGAGNQQPHRHRLAACSTRPPGTTSRASTTVATTAATSSSAAARRGTAGSTPTR